MGPLLKLLFVRIPRGIWQALTWLRILIANMLVLVVLVLALTLMFGEKTPPIPEKCALVLNLEGDIVETPSPVAPIEYLFAQADGVLDRAQTRLQDVLDVIGWAQDDDRIQALVLDTENLGSAGLTKLQAIGRALARFRKSGKPVLAVGNRYNQRQYYLAAFADEVHLNPMGGILLSGFGVYRQYFKQALDKLDIDVHVFRVGSYKSALEPFDRDDMSEAARQANAEWIQALWDAYKKDIALQRGLETERIDHYIENFDELLGQEKGSLAQVALKNGLVDHLSASDEIRARLIEMVGEDEQRKATFRQVRFGDYLQMGRQRERSRIDRKDRVGIIVAQGMILDGKQPTDKVGADTMRILIRDAIADERIKALVVRIDSSGGSAFASEAIRRELKRFRQTGRPVVVSMGSMAASGGYWIATAADRIWALPTTLTGSIGIFGAYATLDRLADRLGIHTDGVGTTPLTNALDPTRPLTPAVERAIQQWINHGYDRFIDVVAEGRKMDREAVEKSAQGRVWTGAQAKSRGLVDALGDLEQAVQDAAKLAGISNYRRIYLRSEPSSFERWMSDLQTRGVRLVKRVGGTPTVLKTPPWMETLRQQTTWVLSGNDPQGIYARCLSCEQVD